MHKNFRNKTLLCDSAEKRVFKTFVHVTQIFTCYFINRFLASATIPFTETLSSNQKHIKNLSKTTTTKSVEARDNHLSCILEHDLFVEASIYCNVTSSK